MNECLDCIAEPSMHWRVWLSSLFQQETPKKVTWEHSFIFNKDRALVDFFHWALCALREVESHPFFHIKAFDSMCLHCHMAHEIPHRVAISPGRVPCENFILACGDACSSAPSLGLSVWLANWFSTSILSGVIVCSLSEFDEFSHPHDLSRIASCAFGSELHPCR